MDKLKLWLIIFAVIISGAAALGIGPVQFYTVHEPGKIETFHMTIYNNEARDLELSISATGDAMEYLSFNTKETMSTHDAQKEVTFTLLHPETMKPGPHLINLVVAEQPRDTDSMISASQRHVSKLRIQVPYQKKFAEAKLTTTGKEDGADFFVQIYNFGIYPFSAYADIDIFKDDQFVKTVQTDTKTVSSMQEATLTATVGLDKGYYTAKAIVDYDGIQINLEDAFTVGVKELIIKTVTVDEFEPGRIARIRITMVNSWPEPITARAEVLITQDMEIEKLETPEFTVAQEYETSAYWNTINMPAGEYTARINVIYENNIATAETQIVIPEIPEPVKKDNFWLWLIIVLLFLIIYIFQRKKNTAFFAWLSQHKWYVILRSNKKIMLIIVWLSEARARFVSSCYRLKARIQKVFR